MNNGSDWAIYLKSDTMNRKVQQWLLSRNGNVTYKIKVSETAGIFGGEVQIEKTVVTVNSPVC